MLSKFNFIIAATAFSFVALSDVRAEEEVDLSVLQSIGYEATGVSKRCISHTRIRRTEVVDNYTILFHMVGRKTYANIMERECRGLAFQSAIKYVVRGGTLCNIDSIEVLTSSFGGPICGLGDFHEIEKIKVEDPEDTPSTEEPAQ